MTTEKHQLFESMGVNPHLLKSLKAMHIVEPTQIQEKAIPVGLKGHDILGIAQTGTGKTLAFSIPLLQQLDTKEGRALVLVPTRELAQQVNDVLRPLAHILRFETAVLIGGVPFQGQFRDLRKNPEIIVATPGRLVDMMEQRALDLKDLSVLVIDEADRMFDMGFAPQINQIIKKIPKKRQTLLFSATMPPSIQKLTHEHMVDPVRIEIAPSGTTAKNIDQGVYLVKREEKFSLLQKLAHDIKGTIIVFSKTKFGAKKINHALQQQGIQSTEIHSNRSQSQRREALHGFKTSRYRILIATDIAARGIDIPHVGTVINFDLPENPEDYIHRIGRTGRAGRSGNAISFASSDQRNILREIEYLTKTRLNLLELPKDLVAVEMSSPRHRTSPSRPERTSDSRRKTPSYRATPSDRDRDTRSPRSPRDSKSSRTDKAAAPKKESYFSSSRGRKKR